MSTIKFTINGKGYEVKNDIKADTTLNSYLRNYVNLRGTKAMCHEGGCGICIVAAKIYHPVTKNLQVFAVNSCLVSILSCDGWDITTVEGIGNKNTGYHKVQSRLAGFNGTQCGYCSPGWVMNMYSLLEEKKDGLTMKEVENAFAGNICRCTGYRPILDAFKSFSKDADPSLLQKVMDIEEVANLKICAKSGTICSRTCNDYSENGICTAEMDKTLEDYVQQQRLLELNVDGTTWYKVYETKDIFNIFNREGTDSYMLVAGNTAQGVYHMKNLPKVMIDITSVAELRKHTMDSDLVLGGNMTLNETMEVLQEVAKSNKNFEYAMQMHHHIDLVAHIPVRNVGTIAGNLSIKHQHNEFQSDIFVLLEAVGATITILESVDTSLIVTPVQYLKLNMKGKIIHSVNLPPLSSDYIFQSYKIMPRAQNAHAHVNAGFLLKFKNDKKLIESARIVYGGINPDFVHAAATEKFLENKNVFDNTVLKSAIQSLTDEILPDVNPPEPTPEYRKKLAIGLFYKCLLNKFPSTNVITSRYKSGGDEFDRPVSKGKQTFDTDKKLWPLNQPMPKIEAVIQCSGEALYVNDLPTVPNELYAAFVLSTVYNGTIDKIDKSILSEKGVVALLTAKDIPGKNNFTPNLLILTEVEELLCSEKVLFYGQPIAIVVAETERLANLAAEKVVVTYKDVCKDPPILNIRDALKAPEANGKFVHHETLEKKSTTSEDVKKVVKGSFDIFGQYHYTMETMSCVCVPTEGGLDVYPASQWMDLINIAISECLNIPENSINIKVRRLGGGYGGKVTRSSQIIVACALCSHLLSRPMRFVLPFETNMMAIGKRLPCSNDYEVGVDDKGKILHLKNVYYQDNGCSHNESVAGYTIHKFFNCYEHSSWHVEANSVLTDTASNTWCRAPGTTEGVAMIENIMEHIATELEIDPLEVRLINMDQNENPLPEFIRDFKISTEYEKRSEDVELFNKSNRWRKRGIHLTPMKYPMAVFGNFKSMISVYHGDGTISISHGGIEMGQGLNTKVAQVCSHLLGVPLNAISIKPSDNFISPNAFVSGGSFSSELCAFATKKACEILLERLEPIRNKMETPTWFELITNAFNAGVDLCTQYTYSQNDGFYPYDIHGITVVEVEVDILTGNHQVLRVDIFEDVGESLSPEVDVGQVEGAYIMGLGYWTSENLVFDSKTGQLLTTRTWTYKPPGVKDIPVDFRVEFRRNAPNLSGIMRSKATGEPPICMSVGIIFALRQAITSARKDNGFPVNEWYPLNMPLTAENIIQAINTDFNEFIY